jgi:hypothetical protein
VAPQTQGATGASRGAEMAARTWVEEEEEEEEEEECW